VTRRATQFLAHRPCPVGHICHQVISIGHLIGLCLAPYPSDWLCLAVAVADLYPGRPGADPTLQPRHTCHQVIPFDRLIGCA
jgi:hypothetical protein